jgi:hypothetical protein
MLIPVKRYELAVSDTEKAQLFANRKKIAKVFVAPTLLELSKKIHEWFADASLLEDLNKLEFIPFVKEAEIAYMKEEVSESNLISYMHDIVSEIEEMRSDELYYYTFNDYKEYAENFDCSVLGTITQLVDYQEEIIKWIISDDRLDEFGETLRDEFCKWLSEN